MLSAIVVPPVEAFHCLFLLVSLVNLAQGLQLDDGLSMVYPGESNLLFVVSPLIT